MPLSRRAVEKWRTLNLPISYRLGESRKDRLLDALNVFSNQGILSTRHGMSRYNDTGLGGEILSMSFFKKTDGTTYILAKVSDTLYSVASSGASTAVKTGLGAATKHRAVTVNNRHIIAIGNDGLFYYDGTNFEALGLDTPAAPTVAASSSGNTLAASVYEVKCTFYASTIGAESNGGAASSRVTVSAGERIDVSGIDTTSSHSLVDKVRVYFRDVTNNGDFLFWDEINLGTTTETITTDATSTQVPPTTNAAPPSGGALYLTKYDRRIAYVGNNTYPSDLYLGEQDVPDAVDDSGRGTRIYVPGEGPCTGIATGFFNNDNLTPYLVVFKNRSTHVYDGATFTTISNQVGCVAPDSIRVINGDVFFLSGSGWRAIRDARFFEKSRGEPVTLGGGDIDDIFRISGYTREINRGQFSNMFSVYYSELDQYITWIAEGSNTGKEVSYVYEFQTGGFKAYRFHVSATAAIEGEDSSGNEIIYFGDSEGFVYSHSIQEGHDDVDSSAASQTIAAHAIIAWNDGDDMDASYNFRELMVDAIASSNNVTAKGFVNYDLGDFQEYTLTFTDPNSGFILDVSKLDEGIFSDGRAMARARADINRVGFNLAVGFYQEVSGGNMNLFRVQLDRSKNGNPN